MIAPIRQSSGGSQPALREPRPIGDLLPEVLARHGIAWPTTPAGTRAGAKRQVVERESLVRQSRGYTSAAIKPAAIKSIA